MLTIDVLKQFGANVDDGLTRCMGNQDFYFKLINKAVEDKSFAALDPICEPVCEITELLRSRSDVDYQPYLNKIREKRDELVDLIG